MNLYEELMRANREISKEENRTTKLSESKSRRRVKESVLVQSSDEHCPDKWYGYNKFYCYLMIKHPTLGKFYVSADMDGEEIRTDGYPWDWSPYALTPGQIDWIKRHEKELKQFASTGNPSIELTETKSLKRRRVKESYDSRTPTTDEEIQEVYDLIDSCIPSYVKVKSAYIEPIDTFLSTTRSTPAFYDPSAFFELEGPKGEIILSIFGYSTPEFPMPAVEYEGEYIPEIVEVVKNNLPEGWRFGLDGLRESRSRRRRIKESADAGLPEGWTSNGAEFRKYGVHGYAPLADGKGPYICIFDGTLYGIVGKWEEDTAVGSPYGTETDSYGSIIYLDDSGDVMASEELSDYDDALDNMQAYSDDMMMYESCGHKSKSRRRVKESTLTSLYQEIKSRYPGIPVKMRRYPKTNPDRPAPDFRDEHPGVFEVDTTDLSEDEVREVQELIKTIVNRTSSLKFVTDLGNEVITVFGEKDDITESKSRRKE